MQELYNSSNDLLGAINYVRKNIKSQKNSDKLVYLEKYVKEIMQNNNYDVLISLKGLFIAREEGSGPDNDVSLMEAIVNHKAQLLQTYIDDFVEAAEKNK